MSESLSSSKDESQTHRALQLEEKYQSQKRFDDNLDLHMQKYKEACERMSAQSENTTQISEIIDFFKKHKVRIVKLNHSLNMSGRTYFDGFM